MSAQVISWTRPMGEAYDRGREDGARGPRFFDPTRGGGFDACYWQGVGHAARACYCPGRLGPRDDAARCPCCNQRRSTGAPKEGDQ